MAKKILLYSAPVCLLLVFSLPAIDHTNFLNRVAETVPLVWQAPDIRLLSADDNGKNIKYGKELISNTGKYFGPKGKVAAISNGLNCQNCHLEAGTRLYANNYARVAGTYPRFRERSGKVETVAYRINECMQRSLNGKALDSNSKEMKAMIAYINWIGKDVSVSTPARGIETNTIPFLNRVADTVSGKQIYQRQCLQCHCADGSGKITADSSGYVFPPLWGNNSYNVSAGMYRISRLATFVKYNMPFTAKQGAPQLTDEEAWDVAAYINSQERPKRLFKGDWSNLSTKPVDYPFGPFADAYSETRHKYGPFTGMKK